MLIFEPSCSTVKTEHKPKPITQSTKFSPVLTRYRFKFQKTQSFSDLCISMAEKDDPSRTRGWEPGNSSHHQLIAKKSPSRPRCQTQGMPSANLRWLQLGYKKRQHLVTLFVSTFDLAITMNIRFRFQPFIINPVRRNLTDSCGSVGSFHKTTVTRFSGCHRFVPRNPTQMPRCQSNLIPTEQLYSVDIAMAPASKLCHIRKTDSPFPSLENESFHATRRWSLPGHQHTDRFLAFV